MKNDPSVEKNEQFMSKIQELTVSSHVCLLTS